MSDLQHPQKNLTRKDLKRIMAKVQKNHIKPVTIDNWYQAWVLRYRDWRAGLPSHKWRPGDQYYWLCMVHPETRKPYNVRLKT